MSAPRLLLFTATTGYQTQEFLRVAEEIGVEVVLATDRCHVMEDPWGDGAIAVRFDDVASIEGLAERGPFDGLVALGDKTTVLAAQAAERFGLRYSPVAAVEAARSKLLSKGAFFTGGVATAPMHDDHYPCVVKPISESGSRGVIRANEPKELAAAIDRVTRMLGENAEVLVERYLPGSEHTLEGLLTDGVLRLVAIFDKPDPLEGPFFEETIYVAPSRLPAMAQREIVVTIAKACAALGLENGPIHAEARYNEMGAWVLEVAPRPIGGLCARALRFAGGIGWEAAVIRHAVGLEVGSLKLEPASRGVMMIPVPADGILEAVEGVDEARTVPGIEDVVITAKPGERMVRWPEGNSYPGFIFAAGDKPDDVEKALRAAHAQLRFRTVATLPVVR